jgi:hypothetical protein
MKVLITDAESQTPEMRQWKVTLSEVKPSRSRARVSPDYRPLRATERVELASDSAYEL